MCNNYCREKTKNNKFTVVFIAQNSKIIAHISLARFKLPLTRPAWIKTPVFKILSLSTS